MKSITLKAFAKINLFLEIVGKRSDGYHDIESVMQSVSLCDSITLSLSSQKGIRLLSDDAAIPTDSRNTAVAAAMRFSEAVGMDIGIDITLEKAIPHQAGLGGGSADAAAVLRGLNLLTEAKLSDEHLAALAAKVGSDVPFCLFGGTALAEGRGERLAMIPDLPACTVVIAKDTEGMSTPEAFRLADGRRFDEVKSVSRFLNALENGSFPDVTKELYNGFESVVFPLRKSSARLKAFFASNGADGALMSGSGTSVFALYQNEKEAAKAASRLHEQGIACHLCHPVPSELIMNPLRTH